jgi:2-haloacid dehalogenase
MKFADFRVLTFDCYGTLIDWETGILGVLRPWAMHAGIAADEAELLAAFGEAESAAERSQPRALYPEILRDTHARIAEHFSVPRDGAAETQLAGSVGDWPPFADTRKALERLQRHLKLMVVSNVDRASFSRTQKRLGVTLDGLVTAEDVGAYKPDLRVFRRALEVAASWGVTPPQILHVAQSLYHDHVPAKRLGLATALVQRPSSRAGFGATRDPGVAVDPDIAVRSLAELADAMESA